MQKLHVIHFGDVIANFSCHGLGVLPWLHARLQFVCLLGDFKIPVVIL